MSGRALVGRGALVTASLAIALVGGELIYRGHLAAEDAPGRADDDAEYEAWRQRYIRMNETLYRRSEDPELIYEPVRGASVPMEYGEAGFNGGAMRDDREIAREPGAATRVAMIGDSLVWSEFLPVHDSLPRRMADALGDDYEVLNFGVSGYDTVQEARWYERAVRPYDPAIVVVVWCMNDMMIMSGPFERFANDADRARKDAQEALMARVAPVRRETIDGVVEERVRDATFKLLARGLGVLERWRFDREYDDEYLVAFRQPEARSRTAQAIARLGRAIAADGAAGLFVISPVLESWSAYHWTPIHDFVAAQAEAAGFSVLDPLTQWRGAEDADAMHVGGDNLHYDQSGARVFGRTVAAAVRGLP